MVERLPGKQILDSIPALQKRKKGFFFFHIFKGIFNISSFVGPSVL